MKKFLALYMAPAALIDEWSHSSPEDKKKGMDEWMAWAKNHEADLVEFGNPVGKNKRIDSTGISDTKNGVCGYSIIQAESHEAAAAVMSENPHVEQNGAWIDLLEMVDM